MSEPSLPELMAERDRLFAQLSMVGDFRRGSVSENWRRCGKPNCACAAPEHPGHGPRFLWDPVREAEDRRPSARGGRGGEGAPRDRPARRVRDDGGADHRGEREDLRGPPCGGQRRQRGPLRDGRGKRGLRDALAAEKSAEVGRLAAEAARALGCENGVPDGRGGAPGRAAEARRGHARGGAVRRSRPPWSPDGLRARPGGRVRRPPGRRSSTPCSGRSSCGGPGTTARNAGTAWPRATMSSASRARRCRPAWPR